MASGATKYGAFSGVFTPSVLTILGVIMYLRLGWVVGEAGLYNTLAIILLSHVISISTGLSVSSISTDKRVKAGGIYYILSRSMGLPIGGAIGVTLFVGTALSIALYIIGFSESLIDFYGYGSGFKITDNTIQSLNCSQELLSNLKPLQGLLYSDKASFLHAIHQLQNVDIASLETNLLKYSQAVSINDLRLTGTITIICVTTIAFISTSFAIKTQFFILGAILISLISIFLSAPFFFDTIGNYVATTPSLSEAKGSESLAEIFGIFFPAVTGFTAGVAMSGDLKDPKKDIPKGTILAIAVGLVVYISLTFFLAFIVDRQALRTNSNILKEIAYGSSWFVIAGIWGATLSSALGGILGAPRILQALSVDKITPRIFAKGVGKSNEPRNALILTFLIAEAGILVGDLNAVARLVSMFYLAAYGFINLSCALESWASSDFRPTFKIPNMISITGAISTFFIMVFLDLPFMIAASLIIGVIFIYLTRRQLSLGFGDIWQGVWGSIIRRGLHDMVQNETQERNWRPNIILFNGAKTTRPHLISFGRVLAGRLGILTAFQLIEEEDGHRILPKSRQLVATPEEDAVGVFFRRQYCQSIYDGIENIARSYGFSGIEPNTVLMGWGGKGTKQPIRFAQSISSMIYLDYNVLLLDYHPTKKFGQQSRIDIWWRGAGGNAYLMLMYLKFILAADDWRKARVRILVANNDNLRRHELHKNCDALREEMRIDAQIKIINNETEQKSFYQIIKNESEETDLVMLGMPPIIRDQEIKFIENTNALLEQIGTSVMLVKESSYFSKAVGATENPVLSQPSDHQYFKTQTYPICPPSTLPKVQTPIHPDLVNLIADTNLKVQKMVTQYTQNYVYKMDQMSESYILSIRQLIIELFEKISALDVQKNTKNSQKLLAQMQVDFLNKALVKSKELQSILHKKEQCLSEGNRFLREQSKILLSETPSVVGLSFEPTFFSKNQENKKLLSHFSSINQFNANILGKSAIYKLKYRKCLFYYLKVHGERMMYENYHFFENATFTHVNYVQQLFESIANSIELLEGRTQDSDFKTLVSSQKEKLDALTDRGLSTHKQSQAHKNQWLHKIIAHINTLVSDTSGMDVNQRLRSDLRITKAHFKLSQLIPQLPALWIDNQLLYTQTMLVNTQILLYRKQLRVLLDELLSEFELVIQNYMLKPLHHLDHSLHAVSQQEKTQVHFDTLIPDNLRSVSFIQNQIQVFVSEAQRLFQDAPKTVKIVSEDSIDKLNLEDREEVEMIEISLNQLFDYLIDTFFEQHLSQYERQLNERFLVIKNVTQDIRWLLTFNLEHQETRKNLPELIIDARKKIKKEILETQKLEKDIFQHVNQLFSNTFEKLSPHELSNFVQPLEKYQKYKSKNATIKIDKFGTRVRQNMYKNLTKLRYKQSEGELRVRQLTQQNHQQLEENTVLNLIDEVIPDTHIYDKIPLYYKQLFVYKHNLSDDFWFGRKRQLEKAHDAYRRFMEGYDSATVIIGKPHAGKSFLSNYIARKYFSPNQIFTINPPERGSINPQIFEKVLENSTRFTGKPIQIIEQLPPKSVIVFDDLELWWERSPSGYAILNTIFDLVDRYANRHFFVFNINEFAFKLISTMQNTGHYFLNVIRCTPFNAQELKEVILSRHRSTPLTFQLNDKSEQHIPNYEIAGLFTAHFNYSKGNIGTALHAWLRHIRDANDNTLVIQKPIMPKNTIALRYLSPDDYLIIVQLILHKNLTIGRLSRILLEPKSVVLKKVGTLKRIAIIQAHENDILTLNVYMIPYLIDELTRRNML